MGVLSLHNECPPLGFGEEAKACCDGLITGEVATSSLLKTVADCINFLASIDDTVGAVIGQWRAMLEGPPPSHAPGANGNGQAQQPSGFPGLSVLEHYTAAFDRLAQAVAGIDEALEGYRKLRKYAAQALEAGRGKEFQAKLEREAGGDFTSLVNKRIELLRKVKVRVLLLRNLQPLGEQQIQSFDFPGFFLVVMQPIRDLAIDVNTLLNETVSGALACHATLMQSCRLLGEGMQEMRPPAGVGELQLATY